LHKTTDTKKNEKHRRTKLNRVRVTKIQTIAVHEARIKNLLLSQASTKNIFCFVLIHNPSSHTLPPRKFFSLSKLFCLCRVQWRRWPRLGVAAAARPGVSAASVVPGSTRSDKAVQEADHQGQARWHHHHWHGPTII
jgi:hypothetical protein